jgi:hypothetical protein
MNYILSVTVLMMCNNPVIIAAVLGRWTSFALSEIHSELTQCACLNGGKPHHVSHTVCMFERWKTTSCESQGISISSQLTPEASTIYSYTFCSGLLL